LCDLSLPPNLGPLASRWFSRPASYGSLGRRGSSGQKITANSTKDLDTLSMLTFDSYPTYLGWFLFTIVMYHSLRLSPILHSYFTFTTRCGRGEWRPGPLLCLYEITIHSPILLSQPTFTQVLLFFLLWGRGMRAFLSFTLSFQITIHRYLPTSIHLILTTCFLYIL
jgi:hypothetical protein